MSSMSLRKTLAATAAVSALLLTAACGSGSDDDDAAAPPTSESTPSASTGGGTSATGSYAAGDYEAEGEYLTPGGQVKVGVEMTLDADGTITDVTVTPEAAGGNALQFQRKFAKGISDEIVGRSIDEIKVSKVAGSSLTSGGFNAALDEIKADAAA